MAERVFSPGPMGSGESTLAVRIEHKHTGRGKGGLVFAKHDRAGEAVVSSRLGLCRRALEVTDDLDFWDTVVALVTEGRRVDFLVCDEAQFYSPRQKMCIRDRAYPMPEDAVRAVAAATRYAQWRARDKGTLVAPTGIDKACLLYTSRCV